MAEKIPTTLEDAEKTATPLYRLRHSCAHVLAQAVQDLFPGTKIAIGPPVEDGFYYDFDRPEPFTPEDLEKIEKRMRQIVEGNHKFVRSEISREEAKTFWQKRNETYKLEIIQKIPEGQKITHCQHDTFIDLCAKPHLESTKEIRHFKLLSIAGAYWLGDEKAPQLQRIYGTAWFSKQELDDYLKRLEEAKKRDHRKLGVQLDLFSIHQEEAGPGLIFWHPKGALIRKIMEDFWRAEHQKHGYDFVVTPHIAKVDLWKTSGHWEFYQENMYKPIDIEGQPYLLKPMNCPGHILIYKKNLHSYKDLPLRFCELGTVYRYERSGVLHGLMRVRGFTQDDSHIFCRPDQLEEEIGHVLDLVFFILKTFGFAEYEIRLSTRPEKYVGTLDHWDLAEKALAKALEKQGLRYEIDPGEGVFYGPKIDIKIKDCLGRLWQCSTVQVDFNLPARFEVTYRDAASHDETAIMVHRALMGSLERFFGILIEHYAGIFPLWLAAVQAKVLTITPKNDVYAMSVAKELGSAGLRVETDLRNEKINLKIREATLQKIPYLLVVGDKEMEQKTVAVRQLNGENLGAQPVSAFLAMAQEKIASRSH